jgi:SSS family solute:Na+ symporter
VVALHKVGGLATLAREYPEHFHLFLPATHRQYPWTGVFTGFLTVGLWYSCTSQHIVQRVLSAKDEWHARMGVISAGYLRIITPLFFAVPGICAYKLYPTLKDKPDLAYLTLVKDLIPVGLTGVILAGMAAALMSTVSAVLNSTSTLLTIDIYKKLLRPRSTDREEVIFGQVSSVIVLVVSVFISFLFLESREELFRLVQRIFFYIAPPFAVVFLFGLIWRRANAAAATATIVAGFLFRAVLEFVLFPHVSWLKPYRLAYQNGALIDWVFCVILMVVVSLATRPPPAEQVDGIIWNRSFLQLPPEERDRYRGWKDFRLWWSIFVNAILGIYAWFAWFQFGRA